MTGKDCSGGRTALLGSVISDQSHVAVPSGNGRRRTEVVGMRDASVPSFLLVAIFAAVHGAMLANRKWLGSHNAIRALSCARLPGAFGIHLVGICPMDQMFSTPVEKVTCTVQCCIVSIHWRLPIRKLFAFVKLSLTRRRGQDISQGIFCRHRRR